MEICLELPVHEFLLFFSILIALSLYYYRTFFAYHSLVPRKYKSCGFCKARTHWLQPLLIPWFFLCSTYFLCLTVCNTNSGLNSPPSPPPARETGNGRTRSPPPTNGWRTDRDGQATRLIWQIFKYLMPCVNLCYNSNFCLQTISLRLLVTRGVPITSTVGVEAMSTA